MAETSRSQITITLGRSGQVVKREGPISNNVSLGSHPIPRIKRSVRDRLGSDIDETQFSYKRQRGDGNRFGPGAAKVDDMRLHKDDLRFKLTRKNMFRGAKTDGQNGVDLRDKLSRATRPSTASVDSWQRLPKPNDARQRLPLEREVSLVRKISASTRSADRLPQSDLLRNPYSSWTSDRSRQRSPDEDLVIFRGHSPRRNNEDLRRSAMRTYDDKQKFPYMSTDIRQTPRALSSATYMSTSTVPARSLKPVAPLRSFPTSPRGMKSSYTIDEHLTVDSLLHSLGLGKYAINFKAEEVDLTVLRQMRDGDLKDLGIPMGPRKKIILALLPSSKRKL